MKQKKITQITSGILLLTALFLLTGCTGKEPAPEETTTLFTLNIEDVKQTVLDAGVFEDEIAAIDISYSEMLMGITASDFTDGMILGGSGATAEILAVFETADASAAASLKEKCQTYVSKQIQSYTDYKPAEVDKLNHAVVKSSAQYVIVCVAADYETAQTVIAQYFSQ